MTNEERDIITRFIERVGGAGTAPSAGRGSVPGTAVTQPLPPTDPEADRLIGELFTRYPEARYRITQMAFVQEHALAEAQNRIWRLEWELEQAKAQPKGAFGGLFGGGQRGPATPPPQPIQAPGYQPGMFQRAGGMGFLGTAAATAMGIGGGMLLGNMLMNMFSGGGAQAAGDAASAAASPWTNPAESPWAGPAKEDAGAEAADTGEEKSAWGAPDPGADEGWDSADAGTDDGGGWDDEV